MIPVKTRETVLRQLQADIRNLDSGLNVADHSVAYDVALFPASVIGADLFLLADFVNRSRTVSGLKAMIQDQVYKERLRVLFGYDTVTEVETLLSSLCGGLVGNWGVSRTAAVKSRVPVRFYAATSASVTIAAGKRISTRGASPVVFQTLSGVTGATPTLDSARALYYVELMCEAATAGAGGNVATDRLVVLVDSINGITQCSNPIAAFDGKDAELDLDLLDRAVAKWSAWSIDSRGGLEALFESQPGVDDVYVAGPGDSLLARTGAVQAPVDVFVSSTSRLVQETETLTLREAIFAYQVGAGITNPADYPPTSGSTFYYYPGKQPVYSIDSISGSTSGAYSFTADTDTDSPVSGSTRSRSRALVTIGAGADLDETLTIKYTYDAQILALQNTIDSPRYDLQSTDVLVRDGLVLSISITGDVTTFIGDDYPSEATVQAVVEADLAIALAGGETSAGRYFAAHKLGERLDRSDLLLAVAEVFGVDRVVSFVVEVNGETVDVSYTPKNSEYVRLGSVTWV